MADKPKPSSRVSSTGILLTPSTPARKTKTSTAKPASKKSTVKKELLTDIPLQKISVESDMEFTEIVQEKPLKPILKNSIKKYREEEELKMGSEPVVQETNILKHFVRVADEERADPMELPIEKDGRLLQSTLHAQYPGACGLKFRNVDTNVVRGVRFNDGGFYPPSSDYGWGNQVYFCVFPKETKRKMIDNMGSSAAKTKRIEQKCTDLIVLGLTLNTTEEMLREHFAEFGDVEMTQIKTNKESGISKGYGFVRFSDLAVQKRVLTSPHTIDGKNCEVKVPNSKNGMLSHISSKIFVGRCNEKMTAEEYKEYFSKFGEVTDVFIPKPFRSFCFVTFLEPEVAQSLCGRDHIIDGHTVFVSSAAPKPPKMRNNFNNGNNNNNFNRQDNYGRGNQNNDFGNNMNGGGSGFNDWGNIPNNNNMNGMAAINNLFSGLSSNNRMQGNNNPQQQQSGGWNNQNLKALGTNSQGKNSSNLNNPLGALVAAALSQWVGNLPNQSLNQVKT